MDNKDFIRKIELSYRDLQLLKSVFLDCHFRLSRDIELDEWIKCDLRRLEYFIGVCEACFDSLEGLDTWPKFSCTIELLK